MFEEIGHHVEKIKRVRYGPLTLDVELGKFRELTLKEVDSLKFFRSKPRTANKLRSDFRKPERKQKSR
jgi:23S rRNA pseudouridine2605 synthase